MATTGQKQWKISDQQVLLVLKNMTLSSILFYKSSFICNIVHSMVFITVNQLNFIPTGTAKAAESLQRQKIAGTHLRRSLPPPSPLLEDTPYLGSASQLRLHSAYQQQPLQKENPASPSPARLHGLLPLVLSEQGGTSQQLGCLTSVRKLWWRKSTAATVAPMTGHLEMPNAIAFRVQEFLIYKGPVTLSLYIYI